MKPIVFFKLARAEFDGAAGFYEGRRPGLGAKFREAVEAAIRRIQKNPLAGSKYGRTDFRYVLFGGSRLPSIAEFATTRSG